MGLKQLLIDIREFYKQFENRDLFLYEYGDFLTHEHLERFNACSKEEILRVLEYDPDVDREETEGVIEDKTILQHLFIKMADEINAGRLKISVTIFKDKEFLLSSLSSKIIGRAFHSILRSLPHEMFTLDFVQALISNHIIVTYKGIEDYIPKEKQSVEVWKTFAREAGYLSNSIGFDLKDVFEESEWKDLLFMLTDEKAGNLAFSQSISSILSVFYKDHVFTLTSDECYRVLEAFPSPCVLHYIPERNRDLHMYEILLDYAIESKLYDIRGNAIKYSILEIVEECIEEINSGYVQDLSQLKSEYFSILIEQTDIESVKEVLKKNSIRLFECAEQICQALMAKSFDYLPNIPSKYLTSEYIEAVVKNDPQQLKVVPFKQQTKELCRYVVEQDPVNIKYVKKQNQTEELCLYALGLSNTRDVFRRIHLSNRSKAVSFKYFSEQSIKPNLTIGNITKGIIPSVEACDEEFIDMYVGRRLDIIPKFLKGLGNYNNFKLIQDELIFFQRILPKEMLEYFYTKLRSYPFSWCFNRYIKCFSLDEGFDFLKWYQGVSGRALEEKVMIDNMIPVEGGIVYSPNLLIAMSLSRTFMLRSKETMRFDYETVLNLYESDIKTVLLKFSLWLCDVFSGDYFNRNYKDDGMGIESVSVSEGEVLIELRYSAAREHRGDDTFWPENTFNAVSNQVSLNSKRMFKSTNSFELYLTFPLTDNIYYRKDDDE